MMALYKANDPVWVKFSQFSPWWPALVVCETEDDRTGKPKKQPIATVNFLSDHSVLEVTSAKKIKPFNCPEKPRLIAIGHRKLTDTNRLGFQKDFDYVVKYDNVDMNPADVISGEKEDDVSANVVDDSGELRPNLQDSATAGNSGSSEEEASANITDISLDLRLNVLATGEGLAVPDSLVKENECIEANSFFESSEKNDQNKKPEYHNTGMDLKAPNDSLTESSEVYESTEFSRSSIEVNSDMNDKIGVEVSSGETGISQGTKISDSNDMNDNAGVEIPGETEISQGTRVSDSNDMNDNAGVEIPGETEISQGTRVSDSNDMNDNAGVEIPGETGISQDTNVSDSNEVNGKIGVEISSGEKSVGGNDMEDTFDYGIGLQLPENSVTEEDIIGNSIDKIQCIQNNLETCCLTEGSEMVVSSDHEQCTPKTSDNGPDLKLPDNSSAKGTTCTSLISIESSAGAVDDVKYDDSDRIINTSHEHTGSDNESDLTGKPVQNLVPDLRVANNAKDVEKRGRGIKRSLTCTKTMSVPVSPRRSTRVTALPDRLDLNDISPAKRKKKIPANNLDNCLYTGADTGAVVATSKPERKVLSNNHDNCLNALVDVPNSTKRKRTQSAPSKRPAKKSTKAEYKCSNINLVEKSEENKERVNSASRKPQAKTDAEPRKKKAQPTGRGRKRALTLSLQQDLPSSSDKSKKRKILDVESESDRQEEPLPPPSRNLDALLESLKTPSKLSNGSRPVRGRMSKGKKRQEEGVTEPAAESVSTDIVAVPVESVSNGNDLGRLTQTRDDSPDLGLGPSRCLSNTNNGDSSKSSEHRSVDKLSEELKTPSKLPQTRAKPARKARKSASAKLAKKRNDEKGTKKTKSSVYAGLLEDLENPVADCLGSSEGIEKCDNSEATAAVTKRLPVMSYDPNLDRSGDSCEEDEEDDDDDMNDLPEAFCSLLAQTSIPKFSEGDFVWVKWAKFPYWPCMIRHVYYTKKKVDHLSVLFVGDFFEKGQKGLRVRYTNKGIQCYSCPERVRFIDDGKNSQYANQFEAALNLIEEFLTKKGLGLTKQSSLEYFAYEEETWSDDDEDSQQPHPKTTPEEEKSKESDEEEEDDDESIIEISEDTPMSKKLAEIKMKRRDRYKEMVEFIKSEEVKNYLFEIYFGKKKSELGDQYKAHPSDKDVGFGPIDDDIQCQEIQDKLMEWFAEICRKSAIDVTDNFNYVSNVWIPEAIVYAMRKTKSYTTKTAWERFEKGVYWTKVEHEHAHQEIINSIENTSSEALEVHRMCIEAKTKRFLVGL